MNELELTALFERLGARDPSSWAQSQIHERIPQLARFQFLGQAWRLVVDENDTAWIESALGVQADAPGRAIHGALQRALENGISKRDVTAIVRVMQRRLLFGLCYLLDDPGDVEPEAADIAWSLFQVNDEGRPLAVINGLHESVLETDPTGREMMPPD